MLNRLINERQKIKSDCQKSPITINIITDKAAQISKLSSGCKDEGVEINFGGDADDSTGGDGDSGSRRPDGIKPPTNKVKPNAFDSTNPVHDKENPGLTNLEEYGYGFWVRFLVYYPVRMPNGKN